MQYFERQNDSLIFRLNGETVMVSPWGEDSLRTRAALFNELSDNSPALLSPAKSEPVIELGERQAVITNGKIHAVLSLQDWGDELQISYYNQKGELLLQEIPNGGALFLKARRFQSLPGDSFFLTASFVSNPSEKIYGMGQYQQETLNLKGCNLELAHRNSQASIPFYVSSLGYGFLWNNAAVGDVHFGTNTTQWTARSCKQLDYWITAGDTPAEIEEAYANATGKSPMMPEYGLGFWQCKLRYYNQEQVLSIAREYKKRNIPLDVIVIDFYHWPYCGDWRFDDGAIRLRHQTTHTCQLLDLLVGTTGTGVRHHEDVVVFIQTGQQYVGQLFIGLVPGLYDCTITLFLSDQTTAEVLCDAVYSCLRVFQKLRLGCRHGHIRDGYGHGCSGRILVTDSLDIIQCNSSLGSAMHVDDLLQNLL